MKVLLIKPYNLSDHIQPPLGLGYLATAIRNKHKVEILDCIKENVKINDLRKKIEANKPDLVGIQCYTLNLGFVKRALRICSEISPRIIKIIGGPHPSSVPIDTMNFFDGQLDYGFAGEAEVGFPLLLEQLDKSREDFGDIPGLIWQKNGKTNLNRSFFQEDLDNFGLPSWDLLQPQTYPPSQHGAFFKNFPIAPLIITRGCPYECTFCAGNLISGKKFRKRSIDNVIDEVLLLHNQYGIKEFHIVDDNFTLDTNYAKDFFKKVCELNLDISWATPNGIRINTLDKELLDLMKKAGLYLVSLGIESGSDRILGLMKKDLTVKKIKEKIEMIKDSGIDIAGFFIIGYPTETIGEIRKTIRFSKELGLKRANYFTFLPFPGTESFNELAKDGKLEKIDWEKFYFMSAPYVPETMTRRKLRWLQREAFIRFYFRPKILVENLADVKSFNHLKFLIKRFFHWIII